MSTKRWLKLGVVGRAHGLRGSFFVSGRDEPIPAHIKKIWIGDLADQSVAVTIEQIQWQSGRPVLKCDIASDRTAAEKWIGKSLWLPVDEIRVDDANEYLLMDLKGRTVLDSANAIVGTVDDVFVLPASINLIVLNADGSGDVEIPMIATYVDMGFMRGGSEIRLVVLKDTFEEVWNPRIQK
jgi:16S rRNA processing protein RimM